MFRFQIISTGLVRKFSLIFFFETKLIRFCCEQNQRKLVRFSSFRSHLTKIRCVAVAISTEPI